MLGIKHPIASPLRFAKRHLQFGEFDRQFDGLDSLELLDAIGCLCVLLTGLVAAVLNKSPDDPECVIRAHTIMGQAVVFEMARVVLFRCLDWDGYNDERSAQVAGIVARSITNSLGLPDPDFDQQEESFHDQR